MSRKAPAFNVAAVAEGVAREVSVALERALERGEQGSGDVSAQQVRAWLRSIDDPTMIAALLSVLRGKIRQIEKWGYLADSDTADGEKAREGLSKLAQQQREAYLAATDDFLARLGSSLARLFPEVKST
jgi:hypothetical protein